MAESIASATRHEARHVPTLLELAGAAAAPELPPLVGGGSAGLGPSVGDDTPPTSLGPSVGDDTPSDRRRKTDVRRVGTTVFGLPLYDFRYIGGTAVYRGVMADDVLAVVPDAVVTDADGFLRVRYGMLGTAVQRVA